MGNEKDITLEALLKIVTKRKLFIFCIASLIIIASAIFLYTRPATYTATIQVEISSARVYSINAFSNDFVLNSPGPERMLPIHIHHLKSKAVLERILSNFETEDINAGLSPEILSRKLTVKKAPGKGKLILQATDSTANNAIRLVNTWAQVYQNYNKAMLSLCMEDISLAYNEIQLVRFKERLEQLQASQRAHKELLDEIETKMTRMKDQAGLEAARTLLNMQLLEKQLDISELQERQHILMAEMEEKKIKINRLREKINLSLPGVLSFEGDGGGGESNVDHRTLAVLDDALIGVFTFNSLAHKAQAPFLPKTAILIGIAPFAIFFAILIICLHRICSNRYPPD